MLAMLAFVKTSQSLWRIPNLVLVFACLVFFANCGTGTNLSFSFPSNIPAIPGTDTGTVDEPVTESTPGGEADNPGSENTESETGILDVSSSGAFVASINGKALQSESYSLVVMMGSPVVPLDDDLSASFSHEIFPWSN